MIVSGHVQGVFFRAEARTVAASHGLTGFTRNLPNGDVEIVAEGESEALQRLVDWSRHGPPLAQVDDVQVDFSEATGEFSGFAIQ